MYRPTNNSLPGIKQIIKGRTIKREKNYTKIYYLLKLHKEERIMNEKYLRNKVYLFYKMSKLHNMDGLLLYTKSVFINV